MAEAIGGVFEALRQRFNAAGGAIGKLDKWGLPQGHDVGLMLQAGRARWKEVIRPARSRTHARSADRRGDDDGAARTEPRPRLRHADDGRLGEAHAVDARGRPGSLAAQRADHRFLIFRDAEAWLAYDKAFGQRRPYPGGVRARQRHGPRHRHHGDPRAEPRRHGRVDQAGRHHEAAKSLQGRPSLYQPGSKAAEAIRDSLNGIGYRIDSLYQYVRGRRSSRTR